MSKVRTTLLLDEDLIKKVKKTARDEGITMTELVDRGMRMVVRETVPPYDPVGMLPTSGKGGRGAAIDIEDKDLLDRIERES